MFSLQPLSYHTLSSNQAHLVDIISDMENQLEPPNPPKTPEVTNSIEGLELSRYIFRLCRTVALREGEFSESLIQILKDNIRNTAGLLSQDPKKPEYSKFANQSREIISQLSTLSGVPLEPTHTNRSTKFQGTEVALSQRVLSNPKYLQELGVDSTITPVLVLSTAPTQLSLGIINADLIDNIRFAAVSPTTDQVVISDIDFPPNTSAEIHKALVIDDNPGRQATLVAQRLNRIGYKTETSSFIINDQSLPRIRSSL